MLILFVVDLPKGDGGLLDGNEDNEEEDLLLVTMFTFTSAIADIPPDIYQKLKKNPRNDPFLVHSPCDLEMMTGLCHKIVFPVVNQS